MNETQKRIRAYKAALPGLRERVIAVALLLAMSAAMMTSATFAWLTLSRAPEVSNVSTTVTANGNLEIALVKADGAEPAKTAVGDSSAAEGQSVVKANVTWGNLVNLSDISYGLSNIVLRPALLGDTDDLLSQPLKGVDYGEDGRLQQYYNEDYQFSNWTIMDDGTGGYFKYNDTPQYGVRAISTIEYTYVNNDYFQFTQLIVKPTTVQDDVKVAYDKMIATKANTDALAGLISVYVDDRLNSGNQQTNAAAYIEGAYELALEFQGIVNNFGNALFELANVQIYNEFGADDYEDHIYETPEEFFSASSADRTARGVSIDCLDEYLKIQKTVDEVINGAAGKEYPETYDCLSDFYDHVEPERGKEGSDRNNTVAIGDILKVVDKLVRIANCTITMGSDTFTVDGLGSYVKEQLASGLGGIGKLLGNLSNVTAMINEGALKDFEQLSGCRMYARNVQVTASYSGLSLPITAKTITTSATEVLFDQDVDKTEEVAASNKGDYTGVAQDTYGMALDFWVRTNAADSYLVLEGNVLTETEIVRATGTDKNGQDAELSTVTVTRTFVDDNGAQQTVAEDVTVYILVEDGKEVIYNANTHGVLTAEEGQTISAPKALMTENVKVIGYEGENRIWNSEDDIFLNTDSTTQGSGSCYVFYAEDPAQQENSLRLLSNLRIAFVDSNKNSTTYGKLVAMAHLDTENPYEENGKVTIPLVLEDDGSEYLTKTDNGLAIMKLEQNMPTRLMALVYLDGREISNADVLAANDIHGQLNIQFGSTVDLTPIDDEKLAAATRSVSAVIKKSSASEYGSNSDAITFNYETETRPMSVDVKVTVTGDSPANVSAFFMRQVNATQGSREDTFILTESKTEEGVYTGTYTFQSPGNYILRTVMLDGVDYSLPADEDATTNNEYPRVQISGFGIDNVTLSYDGSTVTEQTKKIMVSGKNVNADLSLKFSTGQTKLPGSVRLQFVKDDGTQVSAIMGYDATTTTWSGTANFSSSGVYTLTYVIMDGEYTELDARYQKELDISMGLTVRVVDENVALRDKLWDGNEYSIPMYVEIFDETGEIPYLSGVKLNYGVGTSVVEAMDPDVTWDAVEGCYKGNILITGPGLYNFISVEVGGNNLTTTTNTPPEFNCTSPNPPSYYDANPVSLATPMADMDYILDEGTGNLKVGVRLEEARSARVTAVLYNAEDGREYRTAQVTTVGTTTIDGKPVSEFVFTIPETHMTPYQTGDWTIQRLELVGVYADGEMHYDSNPLIMNLTHSEETNDLHVQVVSLKVGIAAADKNYDFTGSFLESKDTGSITVTITDHKDRKLSVDVSDISLQYLLKLNSWKESGADKNYGGGYDATHLSDQNGAGENDTYTLSSSDGKTYTLNSVKLTYAGIYEPNKMEFTLGGKTVSYNMTQLNDMGMPVFNLKTTKPTLTIDSIVPTQNQNYITLDGDGDNKTVQSKIEGKKITIYPEIEKSGSGCDESYDFRNEAQVKLKLTGLGKASKATLTFTTTDNRGTVHLYTGTSGVSGTRTDAYIWEQGGSEVVSRIVGYYNTNNCSSSVNAGTLTSANTITFEHVVGGTTQTYTVDVDTITIVNNAP